jgi:nickel/cobalt exporter
MSAAVAATETAALCLTAGSVAAMHTLLGPDHYVPFVAMARAGGWSTAKTLRVTLACGLGHLAGSVMLGIAGLAILACGVLVRLGL